jgi:hypothetical protein
MRYKRFVYAAYSFADDLKAIFSTVSPCVILSVQLIFKLFKVQIATI